MNLKFWHREKVQEEEISIQVVEVPVQDISVTESQANTLSKMQHAGYPIGVGKIQEIPGLSPFGSINRVNELAALERVVRAWKLNALEAYKEKMHR